MKLPFIENTEYIHNWKTPMLEITDRHTVSYHSMQSFKINRIGNTDLVYWATLSKKSQHNQAERKKGMFTCRRSYAAVISWENQCVCGCTASSQPGVGMHTAASPRFTNLLPRSS